MPLPLIVPAILVVKLFAASFIAYQISSSLRSISEVATPIAETTKNLTEGESGSLVKLAVGLGLLFLLYLYVRRKLA